MSKLIRRMEDRDLCHIAKVGDKFYYIDSADTIDLGYETMIFECNERGEVENWADSLYVEGHIDEASMLDRHKYIISHVEEYI
jgi:hypothetical protein